MLVLRPAAATCSTDHQSASIATYDPVSVVATIVVYIVPVWLTKPAAAFEVADQRGAVARCPYRHRRRRCPASSSSRTGSVALARRRSLRLRHGRFHRHDDICFILVSRDPGPYIVDGKQALSSHRAPNHRYISLWFVNLRHAKKPNVIVDLDRLETVCHQSLPASPACPVLPIYDNSQRHLCPSLPIAFSVCPSRLKTSGATLTSYMEI